jgi:hypothetical protein
MPKATWIHPHLCKPSLLVLGIELILFAINFTMPVPVFQRLMDLLF